MCNKRNDYNIVSFCFKYNTIVNFKSMYYIAQKTLQKLLSAQEKLSSYLFLRTSYFLLLTSSLLPKKTPHTPIKDYGMLKFKVIYFLPITYYFLPITSKNSNDV